MIDDCRKAFEEWMRSDSPNFGGNQYEDAWLSWQAAWSRSPGAETPAPTGQAGEELVHLVRFLANYQRELCKIRAKAMRMLHHGDSEGARDLLVLNWPIVQGSQNQWDLETIGKQPFDITKMRPAIKAMLDGSALRTHPQPQPQAPVVKVDRNRICQVLWNATLPTMGEPMHEYIPRAADMICAHLARMGGAK